MGKVEVLVAEHYGFRLARTRVAHDDGSRSDVFLALGVSGAWVRRYGTHRPAAFAFWTTRPSDQPPYLPRTPRVGSLIYIPGLKFRLPVLPDIDLDDVRVLGLPMPFLDTEDMRRGALPDWLPTDTDLTLDSWTSEGSAPRRPPRALPDVPGADSQFTDTPLPRLYVAVLLDEIVTARSFTRRKFPGRRPVND